MTVYPACLLTSAGNPAEDFKQMIGTIPNVEEFVFCLSGKNHQPQWYRAIIHNEDYFVEQAKSKPSIYFAGRCMDKHIYAHNKTECWIHDGEAGALQVFTDENQFPHPKSGFVQTNVTVKVNFERMQQNVWNALRMGVVTLDRHTKISWHDNSFMTKTYRGQTLKGQLSLTNELPYKMSCVVTNDAGLVQYAYELRYKDFLKEAPYIPRTIDYYNISQDKLSPLMTFTIENIKFATNKIPQKTFAKDRYNDRSYAAAVIIYSQTNREFIRLYSK